MATFGGFRKDIKFICVKLLTSDPGNIEKAHHFGDEQVYAVLAGDGKVAGFNDLLLAILGHVVHGHDNLCVWS